LLVSACCGKCSAPRRAMTTVRGEAPQHVPRRIAAICGSAQDRNRVKRRGRL